MGIVCDRRLQGMHRQEPRYFRGGSGVSFGLLYFFFFSSRRRHTRCSRDWSSDVCSSDLLMVVSTFMLRQPAVNPIRASFATLPFLYSVMLPSIMMEDGASAASTTSPSPRSEERRVGKECRSRMSREQ